MSELFSKEKEFYNQIFNGETCNELSLIDIVFDSCEFITCDFSSAIFRNCEFIDCSFEKCNLNSVSLNNSKFSDVVFNECKLLGVDWTKAYWRDLALGSALKFIQCMINSSSFYGLNQSEIEIKACRAHDVDFREADFSKANFSETDLSNSLFSNTNLTSAKFTDAINYDINITRNNVEHASFSRYEAVRLLDTLGINLVD